MSSVIIDLIATLRSFIMYAGGAIWLPSDSVSLATSLMEPEASAALTYGFVLLPRRQPLRLRATLLQVEGFTRRVERS